jgi:hypothetical protein
MSGKALSLSIAGCALAVSLAAAAGPTRADALSFQKKVDDIKAFSAKPPTTQTRRVTVTENEVNAYLNYELKDEIPAGVVEPGLSILAGGRVTARAVVDLDAVRKQQARSLLDPLNYVSGRLPMTATGVLTTSNGVARMQFESAAIGRLPVPKIVLQEIVSYYSRSESHPSGIGLDDPFELPARIREIQVQPGHAIVVQ